MNDVKEKIKKEGFYEDFKDGLNPDLWNISEGKWGGENVNNGVRADNVFISDEQTLILKAHGDYSSHVKRSGAVVCFKELLGPGMYSACIKIAPRLGVCNAFWTFYYEDDGNINDEIDIELPGNRKSKEIGYDKVLNTNWISEKEKYISKAIDITRVDDGKWHVYSFEWHTNPKEIRYYIDGKQTSITNEFVPTHKGVLNVGVWFPNAWCGAPLFEEDYMEVKWIQYVPYDEPCIDKYYEKDKMASVEQFPKQKYKKTKRNFLANGDFQSPFGWKGMPEPTSCIQNIKIYQEIEDLNPQKEYTLDIKAYDFSGTICLHVLCLNENQEEVKRTTYKIKDKEESYLLELTKETKKVMIIMDASKGIISMHSIQLDYKED